MLNKDFGVTAKHCRGVEPCRAECLVEYIALHHNRTLVPRKSRSLFDNVTNDPTHAGHARLAVRRKIPQMRRTVTMLMHQLALKIPPLADRHAMVQAARAPAMHAEDGKAWWRE